MSLLEGLREALADRYAIERELGHGGMAVVFLAQDLRHGRRVAVKVIKPELQDSVGADRFLREIEIAARLQHPHILPVYDSGIAAGCPFYVMPYVEGESLRDRLARETPLPIPEALRITREVAGALAFAHARGIVHRDIKPGNILLSGGQAVVADFGIARAVDSAGDQALTEPGLAIGTPEYMSPEQASGARDVDGRADIYSLGCVLYEMLAGDPPFTGRSAHAVIARHRSEPVPPVRVVRDSVPEPVSRALNTALAKVPADRFASAAEFVGALDRGSTLETDARRRPAWDRRAAVLALCAVVLLGGVFLRSTARQEPLLESNRVVVFPLRDVTGGGTPEGAGEGVATYIGHALDRTEPLKWLEGWELLNSAEREQIGRVPAERARRLSADMRASYYIDGHIIRSPDSVTVVLRLYDVQGDSLLRRAGASGDSRTASLPQLGLKAVAELLPSLLQPGGRIDLGALSDRRPGAIANFLQGEREYRRAQFAAALGHYRAALQEDSSLAIAAIKGAAAASWQDLVGEDLPLVEVALARASLLPRKYLPFARGLHDYLTGRADSAIAALNQAILADSSWNEAWMALGEVYYHLLPEAAPLDSLAESAFSRANALDRDFAPALFHLSHLALRRRDVRRVEDLLARFRATGADTAVIRPVRLALRCMRQGPSGVDWQAEISAAATAVAAAGKTLATNAYHLPCAAAAFEALLVSDSTQLRWGSLLALQSVAIAAGRAEMVPRILSTSARLGLPAPFLYLLDAPVARALGDSADAFARTRGTNYRAMGAPMLSLLGGWAAVRGDTAAIRRIVAAVAAKVDSSDSRADRVIHEALEARLTLVTQDRDAGLKAMSKLRPTGRRQDLEWQPWESLGAERLALADLLLRQGEYAQALRVASTFDSAQPIAYLIYLPASLELRAKAAERLGRPALARDYSARLAALRRDSLQVSFTALTY